MNPFDQQWETPSLQTSNDLLQLFDHNEEDLHFNPPFNPSGDQPFSPLKQPQDDEFDRFLDQSVNESISHSSAHYQTTFTQSVHQANSHAALLSPTAFLPQLPNESHSPSQSSNSSHSSSPNHSNNHYPSSNSSTSEDSNSQAFYQSINDQHVNQMNFQSYEQNYPPVYQPFNHTVHQAAPSVDRPLKRRHFDSQYQPGYQINPQSTSQQLHSSYQPINQLNRPYIHQPVNHVYQEPVNTPVPAVVIDRSSPNHHAVQPSNQAINHSLNQPFNQSVGQPFSQSVIHSINQPSRQLPSPSSHSSNQSVNQSNTSVSAARVDNAETRRSKHREIDRKRRQREISAFARLTELLNQINLNAQQSDVQAINQLIRYPLPKQPDRVTLLEIACDHIESLFNSASQSINRSIIQSINESVNQSINQSIHHSIACLTRGLDWLGIITDTGAVLHIHQILEWLLDPLNDPMTYCDMISHHWMLCGTHLEMEYAKYLNNPHSNHRPNFWVDFPPVSADIHDFRDSSDDPGSAHFMQQMWNLFLDEVHNPSTTQSIKQPRKQVVAKASGDWWSGKYDDYEFVFLVLPSKHPLNHVSQQEGCLPSFLTKGKILMMGVQLPQAFLETKKGKQKLQKLQKLQW